MRDRIGCYAATLTPFAKNNTLDEGAIAAHSAWLIENGIDGLCPAGTTGEFLFLTQAEKTRLVARSVDAANGRASVIAGVWAPSAAEAAELATMAEGSGADGVFLPPPIYYPANDDAVRCWYASVRAAVTIPVYAYNIPQYAANAISLDCLDRMFASGDIAGVKDSTGDADRMAELVKRYTPRYSVFAASDGFASRGRRLGASGFITAIGNVAPSLFARLWAGDETLQAQVDTLRSALKQVGSIPALKYLLGSLGFDFGVSRIPCSQLSLDQQNMLDRIVKTMNESPP